MRKFLLFSLLLVSPTFASDPLLTKYDAEGVRVSQKWGRNIKTETFTADDKSLAVAYPAQLQKLPGDAWLVPSYLGRRIEDASFTQEWSPQSFHYPGAKAGAGDHLIAPFVIRMDGQRATLIALLKPIDDVKIDVSKGRALFGYPRVPPGESITISYYEGVFNDWYAAVDKARELYGIETERDDLYRDFWRPGYLFAALMNANDTAINDGGFLPGYYDKNLDELLGWVQYWGQMSDYPGACCAPIVGFHERYPNPAGLVPLHGDVGYYARTGDGDSLAHYDAMVTSLKDQGHASIIYWDIVGMIRTVDPIQILMRADDIPTFIESASMDLPLASMMGHSSLAKPNSFPDLGRYFLKNRPLFVGTTNMSKRDDMVNNYRTAIELGMGLDSWLWYDEQAAALQRSALEEWRRVGFWADKPQMVRRGVFRGESGKTYTVTLENDVTAIEVKP